MGQRQSRRQRQSKSKEELLYQQVIAGNIEGIRALRRAGAGLEWVDKEGKTPLIVACLEPDFLHVAEELIGLGANVNYRQPGFNGGTPLHHAAKRGLEHTVNLLLSSEANAFLMNDFSQTPLDMARANRHTGVVRAIESHICIFSGLLREDGQGFVEAIMSQLMPRKVWAVVIPRDARIPNMTQIFELAIYSSMEDAQPRTVIKLWRADIFNHSYATVVIIDKASKERFTFSAGKEAEERQLEQFYHACSGMRQPNIPRPTIPATAPTSIPEDVQLAMAIDASLQTPMDGQLPNIPTQPGSQVSNTNGWGGPEAGSGGPPIQHHNSQLSLPVDDAALSSQNIPPSVPSAPASCVICLDAPIKGACVPCGHMFGCMNCLNEIKARNGRCPLCRAEINQVLELYPG